MRWQKVKNKLYITHYFTQDDLSWADLIVFAEQIHYTVVEEHLVEKDYPPGYLSSKSCILNLGEYKQGCLQEDYITKAHVKLKNQLQ